MATYHPKGCLLYFRLITAMIGILLGFSGTLCFALIYANYHCTGWAFVSGVLALITLVLHLFVWKDLTYAMKPKRFTRLKYVGICGSVAGFAAFVAYLCKGVLVHESGVHVDGWFIVLVWAWMTFKWGFVLFWYSKRYLKALTEVITEILSVSQDGYDT